MTRVTSAFFLKLPFKKKKDNQCYGVMDSYWESQGTRAKN